MSVCLCSMCAVRTYVVGVCVGMAVGVCGHPGLCVKVRARQACVSHVHVPVARRGGRESLPTFHRRHETRSCC